MRGIRLHAYLDDILILGDSPQEVQDTLMKNKNQVNVNYNIYCTHMGRIDFHSISMLLYL